MRGGIKIFMVITMKKPMANIIVTMREEIKYQVHHGFGHYKTQ